jgi:hypothetical protein
MQIAFECFYQGMPKLLFHREPRQWEVQQYDKQRAKAGDLAQDTSRTNAIDLGTVYTKMSKSHPKPQILISREGDRAFFNGILYPENSDSGNGNAAQRGRAALERFSFETDDNDEDGDKVRMPWRIFPAYPRT